MTSRRALIVASDVYTDPGLPTLVAPRRDAAEMADVLRDPSIGGFEVETLLNRPHHEVQLAIARFFTSSQRDETLLLYFSGHGVKDDNGLLHFATPNTEVGELLSATAVPSKWVSEQLGRPGADKKLLILDCCYSGAFNRAFAAKSGATIDAFEELRGAGRIIMTASNPTQFAVRRTGSRRRRRAVGVHQAPGPRAAHRTG